MFTVNPDECSIVLAEVRSFGTEDRNLDDGCDVVLPSGEIHEHIIFRGDDTKDIRVVGEPPKSTRTTLRYPIIPPSSIPLP